MSFEVKGVVCKKEGFDRVRSRTRKEANAS
jgi:hypothetical protein